MHSHTWACTKKATSVPRQRDGPRQRRLSVHPVSDEDEYSHAHTNLSSPMPFPQLSAAPPSSPFASSPHAPGGAASELMWQRTKAHQWARAKKVPSVPRQRDGPRQRRTSVHPVSDEDEYSHAHTNLRSPVLFPQLGAAAPSSPFTSSPHAPGGAAGELMRQLTKAHQWACTKKVPRAPRQLAGPRQRRTWVHPVSDEDEYSHAHTNLRSPVSLPQLGAAAPSSPLTTSPHAPGGAAGANARKRIHGRAPKRCTSVHPVSNEDENSHAHTNLRSPMSFPQLRAAPPSSPFAFSPRPRETLSLVAATRNESGQFGGEQPARSEGREHRRLVRATRVARARGAVYTSVVDAANCRNKVNEGDDYCTRHKKVVERLKKETELKDENDVALKDKNETIAILRCKIELAESKTQEAIRNMEALAEMKTMRAIREMEGRELTAQLAGMYMGTSSMSQ
ncbi:hypothetical protein T492DRAFT_849024 [Pavlovales sp. CCMP2436]|nr:hypothetical protein T492DRAFT_849024 [Pavlovales sp. CCMP2436]